MPNQATINPSADQSAIRNIARIRTLKAAIEKATARGNSERVAELTTELNRRMADVEALKAELDTL